MVGMDFPYVSVDICFKDKIFIDAPFDKTPNVSIPEDAELVLTLDPSSKQTGIVLGDMEANLYLIIDFRNITCSLFEFKSYLNDYLSRLSDRYQISKLIYEVPFRQSGDIASDVLHNLEMNFRQYEKVIKGLTKEGMYPILPGVWRKTFLQDKRYNGRRKERELLKESAREECSVRYPQYKDYFYKTHYIPDSTDAIGIYHGFLDEYWYDKDKKIRKVSKINSRYSRNHKYSSKIVQGSFKEIISEAKSFSSKHSIEIFAYNKDFSTEENCEIVTSQTHNICILYALDDISTQLLKWSSDNQMRDESMYAVVCKRGYLYG